MGLFDKFLGQNKSPFQVITPLSSGSTLFEYEVTKILGSGGFGITYLCRDKNLQNYCVIKEFAPRGIVARERSGHLQPVSTAFAAQFSEGKRDFLVEAQRLAAFNHPNIVRVTRFFETHSTAYFVMPFETGLTLRVLAKSRGTDFLDDEIAGIVEPLCQGVLEMHKTGLLHRDIKPDNIIIRSDGTPVLIDLGAAVYFHVDSHVEHRVIATPAYAPPEQLVGGSIGPWTDIYAVGATLYELVAGKPPIPAQNRARGELLRPATELGRGRFRSSLLHLIDNSMNLDFSVRPQSIGEFLTAFSAKDDSNLKVVIRDTAIKMTSHFINWAKPNDGLFRDELVAFFVVFPVIDLSWRLGTGIPDKATFDRLFRLTGAESRQTCDDQLVKHGFRKTHDNFSENLLRARLEEYAASYLIDRQQEQWTYELLCRQLVRNCLFRPTSPDSTGFSDLITEVIDRARGRVKKELDKALSRVIWVKKESGWNQEVKRVE